MIFIVASSWHSLRVRSLVKEVQAYEKETAQLAEKTTKMRDEQADEYDLRQQARCFGFSCS